MIEYMESVLAKIGFKRNWIYETIATTCSGSRVNSAPVGVWTTDLHAVKFKLYKKTRTFRNISQNGFLAVSFPDAVEVFHDALYAKNLKYAKTKNGNQSIAGLSYLELKIASKKDLGYAVEFKAFIVCHNLKKNIRLFNRAEFLALEYLIKKTKPKSNTRGLAEYRRVIKKVAPNSPYTKIAR
jgi:hypothetical protein